MNVVLVGVGMVADTHLQAIAASDSAIRLHGICSRSAASAQACAEKVQAQTGEAPRIYATIEEVAQGSDVDFVIVLTPPNARQHIAQVLVNGAKPVLMEKPIERCLDAAREVVELFEAKQLPFGIVFQHRARASSIQLAELLAGGTLGKVAIVDVAVPWWREQSYYDEPGRGSYERDGGGVLISQAIHSLDLMLSLFGAVDSVQALSRKTSLHELEAEDYVSAGLDFASGAVGSLVASTASFPGDAESITAHCEHGSVDLRQGTLTVSWRDGRVETFGEPSSTGGGADPMAFTFAWHQSVIENFAQALSGEATVLCSGREALQVHQLIDALVLSSKQRCAIDVSTFKSLQELSQ